jgi:malonyl-CoA decarboxylase
MSVSESGSLFDRTLFRLRDAWRDLAEAATSAVGGAQLRPDLPKDDLARVRGQMEACLARTGGEVSARGRAAALGETYLLLSGDGRRRFLGLLATDFDVDHEAVDAAAAELSAAGDPAARAQAEARLREVLEPPRMRLLTQFNALPNGTKFLVDLRAELIQLARTQPELAPVEADLRRLLASWFDVGFLQLRTITWNAPAALLEKLIAYEAVHEIRGWDDLKNRLDSDRRCFAFFHPRMPDEPLIFVEVALVPGMSDNIQNLLDETAPLVDHAKADTAIFYSISNAQQGLGGISFGDFLIKRVVEELSHEAPQLKNFATLSPIPGFRDWLEAQLAAEPELLTGAEAASLIEAAGEDRSGDDAAAALRGLLAMAVWHPADPATEALRRPLTRLAAVYLAREKRRNGMALDPVAHFHLSNGARIERLNWLGDVSARGIARSCGMMVNYSYRPDEIEAQHEAYRGDRRVAMASAIRGLIRG